MDTNELLKKTYLSLKQAQKRLADVEQALLEPIAVIGMGCRFPGGANNPDLFWENIKKGIDASSDIPEDRWPSSKYCDDDPNAEGTTHASRANFLTHPIDEFDAPFFAISAKEAKSLDPQQRLLLEVVWESLEDAALDIHALNGSKTGVFVGISSDDYTQAHRHSGNLSNIDSYSLTGTCFAPASGRISYTFGFQGPSLAIDTACSSSLVAMHLACRSLLESESDLALAAGVNLILSPIFHICSSKLGTISPDGRCKTFDASADGYGRGEGCGVLVLRRLSDALNHRDRILAVIRSTAVNQDGKSNGLTAPNGLAQEALIRTALERVGLSGKDIDYFEAHGTGTPLGDPIELEAITRIVKAYRSQESPVYVGSVKTNIGHLEAAAGVSGAIKVIQALRHDLIPPHLHLNDPNKHIPWNTIPVKVPTQSVAWPHYSDKRRAGVSSFGFSGTNTHVIFEEAPRRTLRMSDGDKSEKPWYVLPIAAKNNDALKELALRYIGYVEESDHPVADVCYTAGVGRTHFRHRLAITGDSKESIKTHLKSFVEQKQDAEIWTSDSPADKPKIAFLYSGQGAQYCGMGRALYEKQPTFHDAMERCNSLFKEGYNISLTDLLYGADATDEQLSKTQYTQPAIFSIQYALTQLWKQWGITPNVITGHSIGEFAAAAAAGIMDFEDAFHLVCERGRIMGELPKNGGMMAVMANESDVTPFLKTYSNRVSIAALNAPQSIVLSGELNALEQMAMQLKSKGISVLPLHVSHAFHSPLMESAAQDFRAVASSVPYRPAQTPVVSTVTGQRIENHEYRSDDYWCMQIMKPVRFHQAVENVAREGARIFLEIGPSSTLSGLAIRSVSLEDRFFLSSLSPQKDDGKHILSVLSRIYVEGGDVDWHGFHQPYNRNKVSLPHYPFQRKRYYMPPLCDSGDSMTSGSSTHSLPLLGEKVVSSLLPEETLLYQAEYTIERPSFLRQHIIFGKVISPAAAHVSVALSAACDVLGERPRAVEDVSFTTPLVIEQDETRTVQTIIHQCRSGKPTFEILSSSHSDSTRSWQKHSAGTLSLLRSDDRPAGFSVDEIKKTCNHRMTADEFYQYIERAGYVTGPHFQAIRAIEYGDGESLCHIRSTASFEDHAIHPGLIDSILQTVLPGCEASAKEMLSGDNILIPLHMGAVRLYGSLKGSLYCHNKIDVQSDLIKSRIQVIDEKGESVLVIDDFLLRKTTRDTLYRDLVQNIHPLLYDTHWIENDTIQQAGTREESTNSTSGYVVLCDSKGVGQAMTDELKTWGKDVFLIQRVAETSDQTGTGYLADQLQHVLSTTDHPLTIINLWPLDFEFLDDDHAEYLASAERILCESVLTILRELVQSQHAFPVKLWLVTHQAFSVQSEDRRVSPLAQSIWGVGRTIAMENPDWWGGLVDCEIDTSPTAILSLLAVVHQTDEDQLAIRKGGRVFTARLMHQKEIKESALSTALPLPHLTSEEGYYLNVQERGTLEGLAFQVRPRKVPGDDELEIRVHVSGLNFRDVLNVLGQYPGDAGLLGFECGGVIVNTGSNIHDFQVGDEVIVMAAPGCMADTITIHRSLVVKKPNTMSFVQAVTIPATFLTAYYALKEIGEVKQGDHVLIHAGAGGVGMAAVQLAKHFGAVLFATAGSPAKRDYLKSMGVHHVLDSRTLDFAEDINRITHGEGVHFVLNSLSGDFIEKSFSVLRSQGWFLEMGKIGIWDTERVRALDPTLHYHPFDLAAVAQENPQCIQRMWSELMVLFEEGALKPLPSTVFSLHEAPDAFRYMAQAKHIGKIVFTREDEIRRQDAAQNGLIRSDATYLITGGLGALGLLTAEWLTEQGATSIVLTGRSLPTERAQKQIDVMQEKGAKITISQGDVSIVEDVSRILEYIEKDLPPLRGIIHAAGILQDGMLTEQTGQSFHKVFMPKAIGAWNLHCTTQHLPLDFFVLYSSMACIIGNMGQGNYSCANAFMDGLAHHRRNLGLPATSINWGPWADVGMAAGIDSNHFARQGIQNLQPEAAFKALQTVIETHEAQCGVFDIQWKTYVSHHDVAGRNHYYDALCTDAQQIQSSESDDIQTTSILDELAEMLPSQRHDYLIDVLQRLSRSVLGYSESETIHVDAPLTEQGFDSLMTVDMRNRLSKMIGSTLPASLVFDYPTLDQLVYFLLDKVLQLDDEQPENESSATASPQAESVLDEIDELLISK